jgi:hypothetical protein
MGFALSDMRLTSTAFDNGAAIPAQYTGVGADVSPALSWTDAPAGTRAFAVICHDPDAPLVTPDGTYGFVHWVLYNIPASISAIEEGSGEFTAGINDFGKEGYGGPMPPVGHGRHQYYFWILALDEEVELDAGLTMWQLLAHVEPKLIGMNRLVGTFERV